MSVESKFITKELHTLLWKNKETVSTAESCTGGNIAASLTSLPGSSSYFMGGMVVYTEESKMKFLGVKKETLDTYTVYSEEVAREMVKGVCEAFGTTYGIGVTGVAGPSGGAPEHPVGTIFIAVGTPDEMVVNKRTVDEGRERNIEYATCEALQMLRDFIISKQPAETE